MISNTLRLLPCLLAFSVFACDGQKDESYAGDALAQVKGTIIKDSTSTTTSGVNVRLVWTNFAKDGDTATAVQVDTQGSFPARFTLDLTQPPPEAEFNDFTEGGTAPNDTRVAVAMIAALDPNAPADPDEKDFVGIAERHVVVYAETDVKPGTSAARFLHGTLRKGYHLMKVLPPAEGEIFDELHEDEGGFGTEIELKLAPHDVLEFPNYT